MNGTSNMKILNEQEKSRGVVLFAFNTDDVDYVKIASNAARLIKHHLNLPTTLITDAPTQDRAFQTHVIVENNLKNIRTGIGEGKQWRNGGRWQAYAISPYDETLLLDSDYLVLDDSLLKLLDVVDDYMIMHDNKFFNEPVDSSMGRFSLPYVWATVVAFRKTKKSKLLFDLVGRIQRNWEYYTKLYQTTTENFRNDFAFAIADNIVNGYTAGPSIPWTMLTAKELLTDIEITDNQMIVREQDSAHVVPKQNLHVMDKEFLMSTKFDQLVESVCQE